MSWASLATPRLRIETARKRLDTLDREIRTYNDSDPYGITEDPEIDGDSELRRLIHKPFPPGWSIVVSELVHHLRSALDNTVWQLVLLNNGIPDDGNQFPIYTKPNRPPSQKRLDTMLQGVRNDHRTFIEGLQPYKGLHIHRNTKMALRGLASLSNTDKHRDLHPTLVYVENGPEVQVDATRPGVEHIETDIFWGFLKHDAPILRVTTIPPHAEVRVDYKATINVVFGDENVIWGVLEAITDQVERIVERFGPHFP